MRSPPAAMRPPSSSCVPRRRPRKHPIMVKPCSRLSAAAREHFKERKTEGGTHAVFLIA